MEQGMREYKTNAFMAKLSINFFLDVTLLLMNVALQLTIIMIALVVIVWFESILMNVLLF